MGQGEFMARKPAKKSSIYSDHFGKIGVKVGAIAVSAIFGALLSFYADEIHAYTSYLFVGGNLGGNYVVQTYDFDEHINKWVPYNSTLEIKHGGTKIFGIETSVLSTRSWRVFGYFRPPFLGLAYENRDPAAVGTGTFAFKQDLPYVLWGYWTGVECDLNTHQRFLAQCPAVAYRADHPEAPDSYKEFMSKACVRLTTDPVACPVKNPSPG